MLQAGWQIIYEIVSMVETWFEVRRIFIGQEPLDILIEALMDLDHFD
jgi:hypothetical protein